MYDLQKTKQKILDFNQSLEDFACNRCTYYDIPNRHNIPSGVWWTPNNQRPVVLVCNYPKYHDQESGKVMQTSEKDVLKRWLSACDQKDFYLTNAFKCITTEDEGVSFKKLTPCKSLYLWNELHLIQPYVVIALGHLALQSLFINSVSKTTWSDKYLNKQQSCTLPPLGKFKKFTFSLYSTYHPAWMMRGGSEFDDDCKETFKTAFMENSTCQKPN